MAAQREPFEIRSLLKDFGTPAEICGSRLDVAQHVANVSRFAVVAVVVIAKSLHGLKVPQSPGLSKEKCDGAAGSNECGFLFAN